MHNSRSVEIRGGNMQLQMAGVERRSVVITIPETLLDRIVKGQKRVEFRKVWPAIDVLNLYFCQKSSQGKVVARASIVAAERFAPTDAWAKYGVVSGVTEEEFYKYCAKSPFVICIGLQDVVQLPDTWLKDLGVAMAPQNYTFTRP